MIKTPPHRRSIAARTLSKPAQDLRAKLVAEYAIKDTAGLAVLDVAMQAHDSMAEAQRLIDKHGAIHIDAKGHPRTNPAVILLRDSRQVFLRAMRNLDFKPAPPKKGG